MNSMVGGTDVTFETVRQGFDVRSILEAVCDVWPDGLFQDAEEEVAHPMSSVLGEEQTRVSHEFFVYKDQASAESWEKEGWTQEHANDMAHFLIVEDAGQTDIVKLTLVIGFASPEMLRLIVGVCDALAQMAIRGPGMRERSRRIDWEAELRAVGYTLGREQFYEKVEELKNALFPDWSADELASHPHEALQFCEVVRRVMAPVPDHLVMKALMNRRKQGKRRPTANEPRMSWGG